MLIVLHLLTISSCRRAVDASCIWDIILVSLVTAVGAPAAMVADMLFGHWNLWGVALVFAQLGHDHSSLRAQFLCGTGHSFTISVCVPTCRIYWTSTLDSSNLIHDHAMFYT